MAETSQELVPCTPTDTTHASQQDLTNIPTTTPVVAQQTPLVPIHQVPLTHQIRIVLVHQIQRMHQTAQATQHHQIPQQIVRTHRIQIHQAQQPTHKLI